MGPIVSAELDHALDTTTALKYGTLPTILQEPSERDRQKTLRTYAAVYLREEVQAENLTRSLEGFSRFLTLIGTWSGAYLDLARAPREASCNIPAAFDEDVRISSFRTENGAEVDFIVEKNGEPWAIELKASRTVSKTDLRGLASFADYLGRKHRAAVWYLGDAAKRIDGVDVLPWQQGLAAMGW